jgi:chromosome segregation ATPase
MADKVKSTSATDGALEKALAKALAKADRAAEKTDRAKKRAKRSKKKAKRAEQRADLAEERTDLARTKAERWKARARAAETQIAVLQDLNRLLTVNYREDRAADATALHFAAEAVAAFAADAVALREMNCGEDNPEYLDHLTFRLRQNLLETRSFLDERGEVGRSADLADLLNALPPDNTRRH